MRSWIWAVLVVAMAIPAAAQYGFFSDGFKREQLIKYTPNWKGERFPDGRPKVPDAVIKRIKDGNATSEEAAWGPIRILNGYEHQWEGNWLALNSEKGLVGRAFTVQFMPGRPEVSEVVEGEARAQGLSQHNVRTMDLLQPGDVVIADMAGGRVTDGVYVGDNLAVAIWVRTGNGFVVYGGIRDREGIEPYGFPLYSKGVWPGVFGDLMLVGVNVPIRVGDVTVMPGDLVVGDREGVTFVPPHLAEAVMETTEIFDIIDKWRHQKYIVAKGELKPSALYGRIGMRNPEYQKECDTYLRAELKKRGLPPPEQYSIWKQRAYSGSGCYPTPPGPGRGASAGPTPPPK